MRKLVLNCEAWRTSDDFYDAFFETVGAPEWHGRNFDALNDSICTGQINRVELPYEIVIVNLKNATGELLQIANKFIDLIRELSATGCSVSIRIQP